MNEGGTAMLNEGMKAPDFELADDSGQKTKLSSFLGKKVVLYFYPKDETPGCTVEACAFRDAYDDFLAKGAVVLGVSPDSSDSHGKFKRRHALPFLLLADPEKAVLTAYGVWGEKSMMGRKYMGVLRTTYLIGEDGSIVKVFPKVKPEGHAGEILALL
jgi:thioredoxin-dependent peroxiredoxin